MELFKAVEKEQKTKAFSKEGLAGSAKLDPKEKEKEEISNFLTEMVDDLGRQVEAKEAEVEQIQAKKGKKDTAKDKERIEELETIMERHKWHQSRLELLMRALANDTVEPEQVKKVQEGIEYYVNSNQEVDFYEDELLYEDFNLDEEEGRYGLAHDPDHVSSQDNQSVQEDTPELTNAETVKPKPKETPIPTTARRPSIQIKSPLPSLATLHTLPTASTTSTTTAMRPAPPPSKPVGEPLKYASAAAAAAAADRAGVGIAPLPPPPAFPPGINTTLPTASASGQTSAVNSPAIPVAQPAKPPMQEQKSYTSAAALVDKPVSRALTPALSHSTLSGPSPSPGSAQLLPSSTKDEVVSSTAQTRQAINEVTKALDHLVVQNHDRNTDGDTQTPPPATLSQTNGAHTSRPAEDEAESVYHLPAALRELVASYEAVKSAAPAIGTPEHTRYLAESFRNRPDNFDAERPRHYKPENPSLYTPPHYPQEPLPLFDDPRLYSKIDTDALFYSFYYRQGTYQQYLAAKALRGLSWRFHKQYQTWFQRHEEPKHISEDYEQGTYRFFDYESTWSVLPRPPPFHFSLSSTFSFCFRQTARKNNR